MWPNVFGFLKGFFLLPGLIITGCNLLNYYFPDNKTSQFCTSALFIVLLIVASIIIGLISIWPRREVSSIISGTDIRVSCKICDLLSQNEDIVIAVNTTFDTSTEADFVSTTSLQGKYQSKYYKNKLTNLDELIEKALVNEDISRILKDGRKTKTKEYQVGTVAKITHPSSFFRDCFHTYLLALAKANASGVTETTSEDFAFALYRLWDFLKVQGNKTKLNIPLIGTGRSGLNCERMTVAKEIIFSFVAYAKSTKIIDELVICITMDDYEKHNMDLGELQEYLNVVCKSDSIIDAKKNSFKKLSTPINIMSKE